MKIMCMAPMAVLWIAVPSASWVWPRRTSEFVLRPDAESQIIKEGNRELLVSTLALMLGHLVGLSLFVPQPNASLLGKVHYFENFWAAVVPSEKVNLWLGAFGADGPRPIKVWTDTANMWVMSTVRPAGPWRAARGNATGVNDIPEMFGDAFVIMYTRVVTKRFF